MPDSVIELLAHQLGFDPVAYADYGWTINILVNHRRAIRRDFEFRRATRRDKRKLQLTHRSL